MKRIRYPLIRARCLALGALVAAGLTLTPAPALAQAPSGDRVPVTLWWSSARAENVTTRVTLVNFERIRVEGYLFKSPHPGTVPVKTYYSDARDDYALVATAQSEQSMIKNGYRFVRTEGYAFPQPFPTAVPLRLYWNASRADHATVAHPTSEAAQKGSGYTHVRIEAYLFPHTDTDFGVRTLPIAVRKSSNAVTVLTAATKTAFVVHEDLAGNGCRYSWIGTRGFHPHDVVVTICDSGVVGIALDDKGVPWELNPFKTSKETIFDNRLPPTKPTPVGTPIDVAIAYSPAVVSEWGAMAKAYKLSTPAPTYLNAYMQLAVDHTNAIFGASGIGTTLRLAATRKITNLMESSFNSTDHALGRIAERGYTPCSTADDPYKVKAFRNSSGADLVSVWLANRPNGFNAGQAWIGPSTWYCDDKLAFSVVWGADAVFKSYAFAHELGHNLGVIHGHGEPTDYVDWDIFQSVGYMYGHVDKVNGFRDIMAYGRACQPDANACPELPYFSTPSVKIDPKTKAWSLTGVPMGAGSANAARRIRERSSAVGGYRKLGCTGAEEPCGGGGAPPPTTPVGPEDPPIVVK